MFHVQIRLRWLPLLKSVSLHAVLAKLRVTQLQFLLARVQDLMAPIAIRRAAADYPTVCHATVSRNKTILTISRTIPNVMGTVGRDCQKNVRPVEREWKAGQQPWTFLPEPKQGNRQKYKPTDRQQKANVGG